ncbi:hypothetical protein AVEN_273896-1 [Araneus ventricosus]|uniref:Uncharacterized protein n=1 Tax=Araneus ventricosus TaxID=182803 RepID=A0A4Y2IF53_ARAVE|nr:hypothetical protein AVEN_273896-1 [Araneus ventricosus]
MRSYFEGHPESFLSSFCTGTLQVTVSEKAEKESRISVVFVLQVNSSESAMAFSGRIRQRGRETAGSVRPLQQGDAAPQLPSPRLQLLQEDQVLRHRIAAQPRDGRLLGEDQKIHFHTLLHMVS